MQASGNTDALRSPVERDARVGFHVAEIAARGFTVVDDALPASDVEACRAQLDELFRADAGVAARLAIGASCLQVENLPNKGRPFERFFTSPAVMPVVAGVLGDDFIAHDVWAFGVPPGAPADELHTDEPLPSPDHPIMVVTIYALGEFSAEIGATRVVPGSHRATVPPPGLVDHPSAVAVPVESGSCIVLRGSVWHSTGANRTDRMRMSVAAKFSRPWLKPYTDFTRSLAWEVVDRATPEALRLYGFASRPQFTELFEWDVSNGRPRPEHIDRLRSAGYGKCCLLGASRPPASSGTGLLR